MKILFLTDNFPPEYNAPATRTFEHCREWVKAGDEVTVITCFPNFPKGKIFDGYKNRWKQVELMDGIRVIRVWSFISSNEGFFKRTLDFTSFALTAFLAGLPLKCDKIVATSPQFFTAISGFMLAFFKRKPWVMEVRDLWPESIRAVNAIKSDFILNLLEKIELFLYRHAQQIVVVTDSFKTNLTSRHVPAEKIYVVKNGVDLSKFTPGPKNQELVKRLNLDGKFVVGYLGTHGMAHGLDFIVRSLADLNGKDFLFLFIGDGAAKEMVVQLARELALDNVLFLDPVKKSEVNAYLSVIDISLVPLKKSTTFESVIPSKIFESAAMLKPILLGVDGESRKIIEDYQAGVFFEPENKASFLNSLFALREKVVAGNTYQEGCSRLATEFNRENLASRMLKLLKS
jgi:glycosyltransferase involved in cell wall biosynthesis